MKFSPKSEKQIQDERFPLIKPGKYHFEIIQASQEVSKKGNDMLVLRIKILDNSFTQLGFINDYLMESIPHKLRHAAYVCGLGEHYERGDLDAGLFVNKTGIAEVGIQKDKTGQYGDKNIIQDYIIENKSGSFQSSKSATHIASSGEGAWDETPPEWVR